MTALVSRRHGRQSRVGSIHAGCSSAVEQADEADEGLSVLLRRLRSRGRAAFVVDGSRRIVGSYRLGPADADDPTSPVAIARIGRKLIVVVIAILCALSVGFAFAAMRANDASIRILSAAFAIVALAAGPFTLVK